MIKTIEKVGDVSFVMEFDTVQELLEYERSQEELAGLTVKPAKPEEQEAPSLGVIDLLLELQPEVLSPESKEIKNYLFDNCGYVPTTKDAANIADYTVNFASNMLAAYGFKIPKSKAKESGDSIIYVDLNGASMHIPNYGFGWGDVPTSKETK